MAEITLAEPFSREMEAEVSLAEFLEQIQWAEEADPELVESAETGDEKSFWAALANDEFGLGKRAGRKKVQERRPAPAISLWSRELVTESPAEARLAEIWAALADRLQTAQGKAAARKTQKKSKSAGKESKSSAIKIPRKQVAGLLEYLKSAASETPSAWELLLLTELLRNAGKSLPAKVGLPIWRRIVLAAGEWAEPSEENDDFPNPLRGLIEGELPWILGLFLSHVSGSERLLERGRQFLQAELEDHTDTDGTLSAQEMERAAHWLTPFVRAGEWGYAAENPLWDNDASEERYSELIGRLSACFAGDGHLAFDQSEKPFAMPLLLTGARLTGCSKKEWPLKFLSEVAEARPDLLTASKPSKPPAKLKTKRRRAADLDPEDFVQQSDWAKTACLRNHTGRDADFMAVIHHESLPHIDFSVFGHGLFQGPWELEIAFDKTPIKPPFDWTCVCWHTDADGDYLELQHSIDENRRIERQIFLSRTDHFLMMADCLSGAGNAVIDYTAKWPVVEAAQIERQENTRECTVSLPALTMRAIPLALPEEIVQSTSGGFGPSDDRETPCLELKQQSKGGLYAPVIFDWTPARHNAQADWRTLTVTENGSKVGTDRAAGHRLRMGNQQLLIYRSVSPTEELRTVLGHHTANETIIARFNKNGNVKPLLVVE